MASGLPHLILAVFINQKLEMHNLRIYLVKRVVFAAYNIRIELKWSFSLKRSIIKLESMIS